jgi:hypothetical protein
MVPFSWLTRLNANASRSAPAAQAAGDLQAAARHEAEARQAVGGTAASRCCCKAVVVGSVLRRSRARSGAACSQQTEVSQTACDRANAFYVRPLPATCQRLAFASDLLPGMQ